MKGKYGEFFERIDNIYGQAQGAINLCALFEKDDLSLKAEMDDISYHIAKRSFLDYLSHHNTQGNNRVFGISELAKKNLIRKCIEEENKINTPLQEV